VGYIKYLKKNLSVSIPRGLKVIDIGSGHAPLIRADVLCDRYPQETVQRPVSGIYMPPGRFVVGDINDLPFINLAFDFSYCSAVLEHLEDPAKACTELSRIARRGLIRVPSALWETMGGSAAHLWLISLHEGKMVFKRKTMEDVKLSSRIPEIIRNSKDYEDLFITFYEHFYIDFYWNDNIPIVLHYPEDEQIYEMNEVRQDDDLPRKLYEPAAGIKSLTRLFKIIFFESLRRLLGGTNIKPASLLACPICKSALNHGQYNTHLCEHCKVFYPIINGIPVLLREAATPFHK